MSVQDTGTGIHSMFALVQATLPTGQPKALLHIGAEHTVLAVGTKREPAATLALDIGSQKTAREFFLHTPPTPLEIEHAIQVVEEEVMRAKALIPSGTLLVSADGGVREIALHSDVPEAAVMQLSLDALERTFNRFSAVSLGRPPAQEGLPAGGAFAATLVILREFMHHLQLAQITVVASTAAPGA